MQQPGLAERASLGLQEVWGLSVDFAKMFNTLSPHIASMVARTMGLSTTNVRDLALPIINACGVWRLPDNYPPEMFATSKGLPQGMASSVLLAELALCIVLWRLTRHDPTTQVWSYVDDLNLATDTMETLVEAITYLREFESDFHLTIANHKTSAWTNMRRQQQMLEEATGLSVQDHFLALGADWMLTKASRPMRNREHKRIQECMKRLDRARHLALKPEKLAPVISVGCLSLIDYGGFCLVCVQRIKRQAWSIRCLCEEIWH